MKNKNQLEKLEKEIDSFFLILFVALLLSLFDMFYYLFLRVLLKKIENFMIIKIKKKRKNYAVFVFDCR
jgi:hypothetical protein